MSERGYVDLAHRGALLQQMADSYERDRMTPVCPCCKRPYKTGAEQVEEWLRDPEKRRVINALAAMIAAED